MQWLQSRLVYPLLDWFLPEGLRRDPAVQRRARMYLVGHLFGTPLGLILTLYLGFLDHDRGPVFWLIVAALLVFWLCAIALRAGVPLVVLGCFSVQHFAFLILLASYNYGGASSPFFTWIGVVPLVSAFYLERVRLQRWLLAGIAAQILAFYALYLFGHQFPDHVPTAMLGGVGIISGLFTCVFVAMMSAYYLGILTDQQRQLEREVEIRRATEAKLRRAKDDAERADRAKSTFLANTSHELRTPLNAILGFAEVIRRQTFGPIDNPRYLDYLKDIHDSGSHLLRIINDILDLSKIEAGKATLDKEEQVDLTETLLAAVRMVQPQAEAARIPLSLEIARGLPPLLGSARMLQQVFINLLSNATKFTPPGGAIAVRCVAVQDDRVAIAITDTGIGMRAEDIDVALTAFGQVENALSRKYDGTGLGLPLAKAIVELHRGVLEIMSEPGRGTTITVRLPLRRALGDIAA
jgi:signal transduction histidine kinase